MAFSSYGGAGEIGFVEDFALAKNRDDALKQLVPGTEDYYYYHCLHYLNAGQFEKIDPLIKIWLEKNHGSTTPRVLEIQHRQALLSYEKDPKKTIAYLTDKLNLTFNHQPDRLDEKPDFPTKLEAALIAREQLTQRAFNQYNTLDGFEDSALEFLAKTNLNPDRLRSLISRLKRPDLENLVDLVVKDLKNPYSQGFGSHAVHRMMLLAQLDDLSGRLPNLRGESTYVNTYVQKLRPNPDVDWQHDPKEKEAYLDRLWDFVKALPDAHNSLKAHILYHRLAFDMSQGTFNKERFLTYIKLPRSTHYINVKYIERPENRRATADIHANFLEFTQHPAIGNDEPLVRAYLANFFIADEDYKTYEPFIQDTYLKRLFAEVKIVNGIGDMEKWAALLNDPTAYQALKERVDIEFAPANKTIFKTADHVQLNVDVKNVKTMWVKVYEINTRNYYVDNRQEINTAVNLDGLVANDEKSYTYEEAPVRRVRRTFEFPSLNRPGVFVVEFIGNGKSSRALIRKGQLRYLERIGGAGHVFTILDEENKKLLDASIWMEGQVFKSDKDGDIAVPFSTSPRRQPIILSSGDFNSLDSFDHKGENYAFTAGIHIEREELLKRKKAKVIVRPGLSVNGQPIGLKVLEECTLVLNSVDRDGIASSKDVRGFGFETEKEYIYEFSVPENLSSLTITVKAKLQSLTQSKKIDVSGSASFAINQTDRGETIDDLHLTPRPEGFVLDLLGKTGEAKANRPVQLVFKHRDFKVTTDTTLQTDATGRIDLGKLADIAEIQATSPAGVTRSWPIPRDDRRYPQTINGKAGEALRIPYMGKETAIGRGAFSLLEQRGGSFIADRFDALSLADGFIEIKNLPSGDFDLYLKESGTQIDIHLSGGALSEGYVLADGRLLELGNATPLQIASVETTADTLKVKLANATAFTRLHVAATRYLPEIGGGIGAGASSSLFDNLGVITWNEPDTIALRKSQSQYVSGRDIGDEYRYILERRYAQKFPGNMLKRPSLILNPWNIRPTGTTSFAGDAGGAYEGRAGGGGRLAAKKQGGKREAQQAANGAPNLDFLPQQAVVLANLVPDKDGIVTIARKDLGTTEWVQLVAVDPANTVFRGVTLPETKLAPVDLRLNTALDPKKHYVERKQTTVLAAEKPLVLEDLATAQLETFDTIGKVWTLYMTLSNNPTLAEFGFITRWPSLKLEEKREKYSKYACHELNFFIYKKDLEFYKTVVLPHLRNKKDKTFMDHWLLGEPLNRYIEPWAYNQLNVVERILLAQRLENEGEATGGHVRDMFDLLPPDIERRNMLFKTALKGSALDTGDALGLRQAADGLEAAKAAAAPAEAFALQRAPAPESAPPPAPVMTAPAAAFGGANAAPGKPMAKEKALAEADRDEAEGGKDMKKAAEQAGNRKSDRQEERMKRRAANGEELGDDKPALRGRKDGAFFDDEVAARGAQRQLYRKLDTTEEWAENNYYRLTIDQQHSGLVTVNTFWNDFAQSRGATSFISANFPDAGRNFSEMMFALAVLDLPFDGAKHGTEAKGPAFTLTPKSALVAFHKEIKETGEAEKTPILASQNLFRADDRYRFEQNEKTDKYITEEFLVQVVYGCQVVLTNPTSAGQKLDVLLQIPAGAVPVRNGFYTKGAAIQLGAYQTTSIEYFFYFPRAGEFAHYPVHVSKNEKLIASVPATVLKVVEKPTKIDKASWDYISQFGSADDVFEYLKTQNLFRVKLDRIAWRMKDVAYFKKVLTLLAQRHVYEMTLWSYGVAHNDVPSIRTYLQHHDGFLSQVGLVLESPLVSIDPVIRKWTQHLEYSPLVNARAHRLGKEHRILNGEFFGQYVRLLTALTYRSQLDSTDVLAVANYLFVQDRVEEALVFFNRVDPKAVPTAMQYDYTKIYALFYNSDPQAALAIADKYKDYPVDRWRNIFADVRAQVEEAGGKDAIVVDKEDKTQQQAKLAATEPNVEFTVENKTVTLNFQNVTDVQVNYYRMDIELLFSVNPFVQQQSRQFAYIKPNRSDAVVLPAGKNTHTFQLPEEFHRSNVMIEVVGKGVRKSQAYYANTLAVQTIESYGQVKAIHQESQKPLSKVYVKVYARMGDGSVKFYKDGYTDLRGRFDYASLNTGELDSVQTFSLLVLSETDGAVIREARPPKQ